MSRIIFVSIISALTVVMFACVADPPADRLEQTRSIEQGSSKIDDGEASVATLQAQPNPAAAGDRLGADISEGPLTLATTSTSCAAGFVLQCCRCSDGIAFCGCRPNTVSPSNYCRISCGD